MEKNELVKVGHSLEKTGNAYGLNREMRSMKNKIFKTKEISKHKTVIYDKISGGTYLFSNDDIIFLNRVKITPIKKPTFKLNIDTLYI